MTHDLIPAMRFLFLLLLAAASAGCGCAKPVIVDTCYTPGAKCSEAVIAEVSTARSVVLVQAQALTSKAVMDALIQARAAGASVSVILDHSYPFQNSALYLSTHNGIPTFIDARHAVADNNVMVIDGSTVITGTMPFTADAEEKNAGNLVIIRSDAVARSYIDNWNVHREHAEEFVKIAGSQKSEQPPLQPKADKKKAVKSKKKKRQT